ncbi:serine kinase [Prodigiosinella confusarubida]|uniref:Serine kinase n=1 Tax=Serratia sp. (strain ATCC 39006) TaxID=104623 RepID=A0A2I5T7S4_SERS3|nr:type III secretion system chaperone [Serratia sp. ATCC 39006]AUH00620.1 serine kinase [Serratia sp. ATCC 39006]AUH04941.1 serine kinase [Serratia sp. ATCC 39006]
MTSTELVTVIGRWLDSTAAQFTLHIDGSPVVLSRYRCGVGCAAVLALSVSIDDQLLQVALQFSSPARHRFGTQAAALAYSPVDEQLWLLTHHEPDNPIQLCRTLETLANQRDVWQSLLAPAVKSVSHSALNLKTLAFLQGDQHAS